MPRHRHTVNVRTDGLTAVLGRLVDDRAVLAALLVDIDSGMVLAATGQHQADRDEVGAEHGEMMRLVCGPAIGSSGAPGGAGPDAGLETEIVVSHGPRQHLVIRRIADPHGDRLALSVLVDGPVRVLRRVRRRLGEVSTSALTAGPTVSLRPRDGAWVPGVVERVEPRVPAAALPRPRPTPAAAPRPRGNAGPPGPALAALDGVPPVRPAAVRLALPALETDPPPGASPRMQPVPRPHRRQGAERPPAPPSALPPRGPTSA